MSPMEKDRIIERELAQVKEELIAFDGFPGSVQRVLRCLHDHLFDESYNVNAILECSRSPKVNTRAQFKYHVGITIRCYLEALRMKAAMQLLEHNELEIFTIAFSIGYASYRTFDRAFRRYVGCSPTEYRAKMSSENV